MHVPQPSRRRAFRKIVTLLSPGATLLLTLRQGPTEPGRVMWPTSQGEIEALARAHGLAIIKSVSPGVAEQALTWIDPTRDTELARSVARRLFKEGRRVHCVWTGARLNIDRLDIDHCLPWSAWPCGDLWNLLPASRHVNQHLKRDRLPSAAVLAAAQDKLAEWWDRLVC
jgi:hypothetical protein